MQGWVGRSCASGSPCSSWPRLSSSWCSIRASVAPTKTGEAGGLQGTAQNLGSSLGTAIIGAVLLGSLATGFSDRIGELRELARGIHPAVLEHGIAPALQSLATRSTVLTVVSCEVTERLPEPLELAAYFVACEATASAEPTRPPAQGCAASSIASRRSAVI